jgi:hypothetical protein
MKILVSVFAFVLSLSFNSLASEEGHGGHEELSKKMNSLFPEKEANLAERTTPEKPALTNPAYFSSISGTTVKLEWKEAKDAEEYHVQVATDPNFKWLVAEDFALKTTSFEVSNLEAGKHYYWRVASVKPNNWKTFRKSFFATSMFETQAVK